MLKSNRVLRSLISQSPNLLISFILIVGIGYCEDNPSPKGLVAVKHHTIEHGETLWDLAEVYYGDNYKWRIIYEGNKDKINDPHWIYEPNEIIIPGINEEIKPLQIQRAAAAVKVQGEFHAEASSPAVITRELSPAAAQSRRAPLRGLSEVAGPKKPVKKAQPVVQKKTPFSDAGGMLSDLSREMPESFKGGLPSLETAEVPLDWREDGIIVPAAEDEMERLAVKGHIVRIKVAAGMFFRAGDTAVAYRKGTFVYDFDNKKTGIEVQRVARLSVVEIRKDYVRAKIITMHSAVQAGDLIKKE